MIEKEFSETIARARTEQNISFKKLGELSGTMPDLVAAYEYGRRSPSLWKAEDVLSAIGYKLTIVPMD